MKYAFRLALLIVCLLLLSMAIFAFNNSSRSHKALVAIQQSDIRDYYPAENSTPQSIEKQIGSLAGINGSVEWESFRPKSLRNPKVYCVQAKIRSGSNTAVFQFLHNVDTKASELSRYFVNNQPLALRSGVTALIYGLTWDVAGETPR